MYIVPIYFHPRLGDEGRWYVGVGNPVTCVAIGEVEAIHETKAPRLEDALKLMVDKLANLT